MKNNATRFSITFIIVALVAFVYVYFNQKETVKNNENSLREKIIGTWEMTQESYNLERVNKTEELPQFTFYEDGLLNFTQDCNGNSAQWKINGNILSVVPSHRTEIYCWGPEFLWHGTNIVYFDNENSMSISPKCPPNVKCRDNEFVRISN